MIIVDIWGETCTGLEHYIGLASIMRGREYLTHQSQCESVARALALNWLFDIWKRCILSIRFNKICTGECFELDATPWHVINIGVHSAFQSYCYPPDYYKDTVLLILPFFTVTSGPDQVIYCRVLNTSQSMGTLDHHCQTAQGPGFIFCLPSLSSKARLWTKLGKQQCPVYHALSLRVLATLVGVGSVLQAELDSDTGFPTAATCCLSFLLISVLSSEALCIDSCRSSASFFRPVGEGSDDLKLCVLPGWKTLAITVGVLGW
jgi:hypothetical protein